ncbi:MULTISPECIES: hypothetical protein [unclassified Pseudoalteromonas]|uniref:hypothetical protein n=1 Tax=unclassified Pseudoalteromonas TaxID=194690 RepID=UPI00386BB210
MFNDKFVYTVCIFSLVISGVYLALIFQGLSLSIFLSSLANLATIGGFILALYAISIWKNKSKLVFVYTELLLLQKQVSNVQGHFSMSKIYGTNAQKLLFEQSLNKVFELENSLRHFESSYEIALGTDSARDMLNKSFEIENFKLHITLLRSLTVTERHVTNSDMSDTDIIYLALNNPDQVSSYLSQMKSIFTNKKIYFRQMIHELELLGKAL